MRRPVTASLAGLLLLVVTPFAVAENWPAWRGAAGTGISVEHDLPSEFGPEENVHWKTPLPGEGNSTPIIWDGHVFVTCPRDGGKVRSLIAIDRDSGEPLWSYDVAYAAEETTHRDNPFCSGSPTTDGELVYAAFGSAGVVACDFEGNKIWQRDLGSLTHHFGQATTPVLYRGLLIIHRGPGEPTHIVGLNKRTGETVWETPEVGKNDKIYGSWSTPVIYRVGDRDEFVLSMPGEVKGYDPLTGKEKWKCAGLGPSNYADTAVGENILIGVSGFQKSMMAVRMGGEGNVTETHRMWHVPRTQQRIGSGVISDGYLYVSNATGIAECIDVSDGKTVWKERLGGKLWGSILMAGDRLYVSNTEGDIFILRASPQFERIRKISMGEQMKAALAPSDGQFFIRTYENLYCVGQRRQ